ncbi:Dcp1 family protein [Aspergillus clavatus NRRL 1]|uniref:Decapping enzyme Dcp1, putative n=1 Tax=Aspergillus clavatus (strain ATCC 1007 / CBS 513.65 / DSM 816 / NCTC 3887 / NRRL 1 / QM 1276 / 107) TaxID=344612 RepID=A1CAR9_ASPCL|nr:decapping enzyme Dcp1, putative [Aspergillus clavatus NRRL 1]EAW12837.1 decapping enzyme Dcp1, putative [Aspergillus clavatus NRRL 1]
MATRRPRRPNNGSNGNNHRNNNQQYTQPSDYESDYPNYFSDTQQQIDQQEAPAPPPPLRSNEELNLSVLRRHNPSVNSILSLAPYAVVYLFNPTSRQWEKTGVEGSLFVCQLVQGSLGEERYSVFVLNRRGLNNFDILLTDGDNVELTEEYVIIKSDYDMGVELGMNNNNSSNSNTSNTNQMTNKAANTADVRIYGLWIYSEPPPNSTAETRTINAQVIRECAVHAGHSLKLARERVEAMRQNGLHVAAAAAEAAADEMHSSVPMGRQISLKDLFGQQRAQDDGWSVHAHNLDFPQWQHAPTERPPAEAQPRQDVLGDLFRRAGLAYQGNP